MLVIGLSLPLVQYVWPYSHSRQPLPEPWQSGLSTVVIHPQPTEASLAPAPPLRLRTALQMGSCYSVVILPARRSLC